jgi:anti-anti-sigma regulatory factor
MFRNDNDVVSRLLIERRCGDMLKLPNPRRGRERSSRKPDFPVAKGASMPQPADPSLLTITRDGPHLIIGFNGLEFPDEVSIGRCREQVFQLLDRSPDCQRLTFDVTTVKILPSAMLGLMASVKKRGLEVEVLNPSDFVQAALRVTKLNTVVTVTFRDPREQLLAETPMPKKAEGPAGDSGALVTPAAESDQLTITRDGPNLTIRFNRVEFPDEVCIARCREQVFQLLERYPDCQRLTFDVTSIKILPSAMLGLLASVKKRGPDVEILNPSNFVQEALRVTKLNTTLTITFREPQ